MSRQRGKDPPANPPGGRHRQQAAVSLPVAFVQANYDTMVDPSAISMDNFSEATPAAAAAVASNTTNNDTTTMDRSTHSNTRYSPAPPAATSTAASVLEIPEAPTGGQFWGQTMIDLKREAMNDYDGPPPVAVASIAAPTMTTTTTTTMMTNSNSNSRSSGSSSSGDATPMMRNSSHTNTTTTQSHTFAPRDPSMLSIAEDRPTQYPPRTTTTTTTRTLAAKPDPPRYKHVPKFQNEVSVDSFGMMMNLQNEISVDGFIMAQEEEWKRQARSKQPHVPIITNEVNVDSIIDLYAQPHEAWRTRAVSESKGLSVLEMDLEQPVRHEINVDSVLRIEREQRPKVPTTGRSSRSSLNSIVEVHGDEIPGPKPFGPPSMLDEEVNVDSVIRINAQARQEQQAKVAALHQQQAAQQQQSALYQWQQKVALQQEAAAREQSVTSQQREELNQISPELPPKRTIAKPKKEGGLFSKMFGGKKRAGH